MDWGIFFKKLALQCLYGAAGTVVAILIAAAQNMPATDYAWIVPIVLVALTQAQNWLKHRNDPV